MYDAEIHAFGQPVRHARLSLADATLMVRDRKAAAVLLDLVAPDELDSWWNDDAFPEVTGHASYPGAGKSGLAIGPTQRLEKDKVMPGLIDYFYYAGRYNPALRHTKFVQLCEREMGATPVRVGDWAELPLVSKREYQVVEGRTYSLPPHCDTIHFGREPALWPIRPDYDEGFDQLSLFLSIKDMDDPAALVIWDYRTPDRPALDALMGEFARTGRVQALEGVPTVSFKGRPGQLHVLNARAIHALESCQGLRRTMGSFAVWHDGGWRIFH